MAAWESLLQASRCYLMACLMFGLRGASRCYVKTFRRFHLLLIGGQVRQILGQEVAITEAKESPGQPRSAWMLQPTNHPGGICNTGAAFFPGTSRHAFHRTHVLFVIYSLAQFPIYSHRWFPNNQKWRNQLFYRDLFLLFFKCVCVLVSVWICARECSVCRGQNRASDPLQFEPLRVALLRCWEVNWGLLQKQQAHLTAEPPLLVLESDIHLSFQTRK